MLSTTTSSLTVAGIGSLSRTRMVSTVTVIKCNVYVAPFVGRPERGFGFLAIRTSIRDGRRRADRSSATHCRGGRLAYGVALIGKTVTTGASQALASSCSTAGGEADGPGHPAGETDTGGDGPCSMCKICCAKTSDGKPLVPMGSAFSDVLTVTVYPKRVD
jgi:hypothetical protein